MDLDITMLLKDQFGLMFSSELFWLMAFIAGLCFLLIVIEGMRLMAIAIYGKLKELRLIILCASASMRNGRI